MEPKRYGWCSDKDKELHLQRGGNTSFFMPASSSHIAVLCNPTPYNAKALKVTASIIALLEQRRVAYTAFTDTWPAILQGFSSAWIVGGDGTMNYFINRYKDVQLPLALFPGGTGNDFHWMLYSRCTIAQQVEQALKGQGRKVDAGMCNGYLFTNGLGIGFDGAIVYDLLGKKKWSGKLSYFAAILKNIAGYRERVCTISGEKLQLNQPCFMISVGNGKRYGGGFYVAPKAEPDDGLLDVSVIGQVSVLQRLRYLPVMEKGRHLHLPFVRYSQAGSVLIECAQRVHAHLDGEYVNDNRFEVKILPAHFTFLV